MTDGRPGRAAWRRIGGQEGQQLSSTPSLNGHRRRRRRRSRRSHAAGYSKAPYNGRLILISFPSFVKPAAAAAAAAAAEGDWEGRRRRPSQRLKRLQYYYLLAGALWISGRGRQVSYNCHPELSINRYSNCNISNDKYHINTIMVFRL